MFLTVVRIEFCSKIDQYYDLESVASSEQKIKTILVLLTLLGKI